MKKKLLILLTAISLLIAFTGCGAEKAEASTNDPTSDIIESLEDDVILNIGETIRDKAPEIGNLTYRKSLDLKYANTYSVDYYSDGFTLLSMLDKYRYLIVPEGETVPENIDKDIVIIQKPLKGVYIGNSPTMSLMNAMDSLDKVTYTATTADKWYIDEIAQAVESGELTFAGKYKEPDYEMLLEGSCNLVIQSTMIDGVPEVSDKFKELEIPLLIDRSGNESHPLGKVEWLKFYGALFDVDMQMVNEMFDKEVQIVENLTESKSTDKTVAIFYITSKGKVYARNTDDYLTEMVRLAGGKYIFDELENTGSNSTSMEMEAFYSTAKEADYILYIYSIGGKPKTLDDLLERNPLISDFKATKEGNVWATCPEFFQITDVLGQMIGDINIVLTSEKEIDELEYLFRLK